jgi:uncharacterized lipoprotein YajG
MRKLLIVAAAALGLSACAYPDTKMVPVEPTASQTQEPAATDATSTPPASERSAAAKR